MNYTVTCPSCGAPLTVYVGPPDHAPWVCSPCARSFWPSELSPTAREAWRPTYGDHGHTPSVWTAREGDLASAALRQTSLLPEQLDLLSTPELQSTHAQLSEHRPSSPLLPPIAAALLARRRVN